LAAIAFSSSYAQLYGKYVALSTSPNFAPTPVASSIFHSAEFFSLNDFQVPLE
jgi:hypothetical protein